VVVSRLVGLHWGGGYFFNPDENNMATAITQFHNGNFDPHFFAYGQFPLYLTYFSVVIFNFLSQHIWSDVVTFSQAIYGLRLWSAIFSFYSLLVLFHLSKQIFTPRLRVIFLTLLIFSPGLIQLSHFGTTESLLILVFVINLNLSLNILKVTNFKSALPLYLLASISTGIGLATKISSLVFLTPIFLSTLIIFPKVKNKLYFLAGTTFYTLFSLLLAVAFSPYSLLNHNAVMSTMNYETSVATGSMHVFYTNQFLFTKPYIFQITHIFPYTSGVIVFLLALIGVVLFSFEFVKYHFNTKLSWVVIIFPSLVYFLYFGQLYVKWTRFMSPIFFLFPLFASITISKIENSRLKYLALFIAILPGLFFLRQYLSPDNRLAASAFIDKRIPQDSPILSEGGNVNDIPLNTINRYDVFNFDFYKLDEDKSSLTELIRHLDSSDYILIPSRRIFKNQFNSNFPLSQNYYENLFNGNLGFIEIAKISPKGDFILNEENAEETWSVFDRPTIRIYQKVEKLTPIEYQKILL
jgi:hypothetical protein